MADCCPIRLRAYRFFALGSGLSWEVPPRPFPPAVVSWIGTCSRYAGSEGPGLPVKLASDEEALYEVCDLVGGVYLQPTHFLSSWAASCALLVKVVSRVLSWNPRLHLSISAHSALLPNDCVC